MTSPRALPTLVALVALLAVPSRASGGAWAAISGGAYVPMGTTPYGDPQARPMASVEAGYDLEYVGASAWVGIVTTQSGLVLQETALPIMLRVRGRLPVGIVAPFVYGGVGFAPTRALVNLIQYDVVAFTGQAGAGVDFALGDMFTLGVEGGWIWLAPSYGFGTVDLGGITALATFALRFE